MPRTARVVVPDVPYHVTQRGNRRQPTFFRRGDYALYVAIMADACHRNGVAIWAYCLMPNHTHLIAAPSTPEGLRHAIGQAHQQYTSEINGREGWTGYLWQGRFASFAMDERHMMAAARYIELNPVRAGLVEDPGDYPWSSARAHLCNLRDGLVDRARLLDRTSDWSRFLAAAPEIDIASECRKHAKTGWPLGNDDFVEKLEQQLGRRLRPLQAGRPRKQN